MRFSCGRMMHIDQLTAGFSKGDAISGIALELQKLFLSWGCESDVYSTSHFTSPKMRGLCKDYREYRDSGNPHDAMIFHFSIGGELIAFFRSRACRKILFFHNITPPKYYAAVDAEAAKRLQQGYARLDSLRDTVNLAITVSEFNKSGLVAAGYQNVQVVPPLIDFASLDAQPDPRVLQKYSDNQVNLLFVGRLVPNKKIEDLIRVFFFYQKTVNPRSRLLLVGSYAGTGRYYAYLRGLVAELDLRDVVFAGHVEFAELLAYYRLAHVFLCMSEHEGFCIPLLEAMYSHVPVIAYEAGAVAETLGGASIVVSHKEPELISEMIHEVVTHREFRDEIIRRQTRRLTDFSGEAVRCRLRETLGHWLAGK